MLNDIKGAYRDNLLSELAKKGKEKELYKQRLENAGYVAIAEIPHLMIQNVIFNEPATIVFWSDNTKTIVKCNDEVFDKEKGLCMAITKKMLGNKGSYYNEIKHWISENDEELTSLKGLGRAAKDVCNIFELLSQIINDKEK